MGAGIVGNRFEQTAEGFAGIVLRVILGAQGGEQIADQITDGIADLAFPRPRRAAKADADFEQSASVIVLAQHLDLSGGIAGLFAKKRAPGVDLAAITQGARADRRPSR